MGHNLTRGDLELPFAPGESWPITQGFDKVFDENDKVVPGQVDYGDPGGHEGIDWGCCSGTPIHAMAAGRVSLVDAGETVGNMDVPSSKAYGNQVRVRTGTGTSRVRTHVRASGGCLCMRGTGGGAGPAAGSVRPHRPQFQPALARASQALRYDCSYGRQTARAVKTEPARGCEPAQYKTEPKGESTAHDSGGGRLQHPFA